MEILTAKNLCKTYGKDVARVEALKNACVSIDQGKMVAVVGPSGWAKVPFYICLEVLILRHQEQ